MLDGPQYTGFIPEYLKDKSKIFLDHCLQSIQKAESTTNCTIMRNSEDDFLVSRIHKLYIFIPFSRQI